MSARVWHKGCQTAAGCDGACSTPLYTTPPTDAKQEPVAMRQEFERWAAEYSTLSLALDAHGHYASIEQEMLWHAWQAAKKNAPEGAFGGESAANDRPGLAVADSTCNHEFVLDFKSSIRLCKHCGKMERKATPPANAKLEQRIAELEAEIENLHTVMMAAAVEITEHWDAHCDDEGYGPANLVRRLENGYPEQYGYNAEALVHMERRAEKAEARIAELEKDAARYRWLRDKATTNDWAEIGSIQAIPPSKIDAAIDAGMNGKQ